MKELKENLEAKIEALTQTLKDPYIASKPYTYQHASAMKEAFEYCLGRINLRPKWLIIVEQALFVVIGGLIGFIIGIFVNLR